MKKIISLCLAVVISTTAIFATSTGNVSEKILKLFHHDYPTVQNQTLYNHGDYYVVSFKENEDSYKLFYNPDGSLSETIKYYTAAELDPFMKAKVNEKYGGKTIYGITEVESKDEHFYQIILQDNKAWYHVRADATGDMTLAKKLMKG